MRLFIRLILGNWSVVEIAGRGVEDFPEFSYRVIAFVDSCYFPGDLLDLNMMRVSTPHRKSLNIEPYIKDTHFGARYLFTSRDVVNLIAGYKHKKLPNHQEKYLG